MTGEEPWSEGGFGYSKNQNRILPSVLPCELAIAPLGHRSLRTRHLHITTAQQLGGI